jgi:hypothetical protein
VVLNALIDNECRTSEWPGARIKHSRRKHHFHSRLDALAASGNHQRPTRRLGGIVIVDVFQVLLELLLRLIDRGLLVLDAW